MVYVDRSGDVVSKAIELVRDRNVEKLIMSLRQKLRMALRRYMTGL